LTTRCRFGAASGASRKSFFAFRTPAAGRDHDQPSDRPSDIAAARGGTQTKAADELFRTVKRFYAGKDGALVVAAQTEL